MADQPYELLISDLGSDVQEVRSVSSTNLVNLGRQDKPVIDALVKALGHKNRLIRFGAASTLGRIGPSADRAIPFLSRMFKNKGEDDINRAMAANALGLIGTKSIQILTECLKDTDVFMRIKAVTALTRMAPNQTAAIPALIKALDDVDEEVRAEAVEGLGPEFFGREAK